LVEVSFGEVGGGPVGWRGGGWGIGGTGTGTGTGFGLLATVEGNEAGRVVVVRWGGGGEIF